MICGCGRAQSVCSRSRLGGALNELMRNQSENGPGLWSAYGPKGGGALRWLILQSKSSSEFWASWQDSSHCSSARLKSQEPGSPKTPSRIGERHLQVEHGLDNNLLCADWRSPLTTVQLVRSIGTVGLVVAHQVGLDALTAATDEVCVGRTTSWIRQVWKKQTVI